MLRSRIPPSLLLILGIGLLVNPYAPGIHFGEGSVHRYEAAKVTYNQSAGLQATDPETGREAGPASVDDQIICEGFDANRLCQFEYRVYDGKSITSVWDGGFEAAQYEFVYLNNTLYRPTTVQREGEWYFDLERVTEPDPLRDVADSDGLSDGGRKAISTGEVMTYRELPEENSLVRYDGQYYVVYKTGGKRYYSSGSSCFSSGEGFCSAADSKRWTDTLLTLGSWVLGVVLIVFAFRSRDSN